MVAQDAEDTWIVPLVAGLGRDGVGGVGSEEKQLLHHPKTENVTNVKKQKAKNPKEQVICACV